MTLSRVSKGFVYTLISTLIFYHVALNSTLFKYDFFKGMLVEFGPSVTATLALMSTRDSPSPRQELTSYSNRTWANSTPVSPPTSTATSTATRSVPSWAGPSTLAAALSKLLLSAKEWMLVKTSTLLPPRNSPDGTKLVVPKFQVSPAVEPLRLPSLNHEENAEILSI